MKSSSKILIGVLAGAAAGALLGILYAPDKGSETRKKITKRSKEMTDQVKGKVNDFLTTVKEKMEKATDGMEYANKENTTTQE